MASRSLISKIKVLHYHIVSPPVRKVLLTSAALEVDLELKKVDLFKSEHLKPEFIQLNPLHKVPVLEDNGLVICDSNAIIIYLAETSKHPEAEKLFPKDPVLRASILDKLFFEANELFKTDAYIMKNIFQENCKKLTPVHIESIERVYDLMDAYLKKNDWVASANMTLADLSCVSTISTLNLLYPVSEHPRLDNWFQRCKDLPYFEKQNQQGVDKLRKLMINLKFEFIK